MIRLWPLLLALAAPLQAEEAGLAAAAQALGRAEAALAAAADAEDQRAALSEAVAAYEEGRLALRGAMAATAAEQRRRARLLRAETADLGALLAALQRISARSEPLFALGIGAPDDVVLAGILVDRASGAAAARVEGLRAELAALAALRGESAEMADRMAAATVALKAAARDLADESARAVAEMPALGEDIANLAALAAALDGVPAPLADAGAPPERLAQPAAGRILRGFGETDDAGIQRPGLLLEAPARHLVRTPLPATIRFAGALDSYGTVVIVEPEAGILFVFAGLGDLLVQAGEDVLAGTGLGFLPGVHEEFLNEDAERDGDLALHSLYIEVRVNGTPVDPALWFAYGNEE
ncbi:MAG: peptidoglycan DD-metalloendopeptidase family protein [Pseudomonadota bacterium]